LRAHAATPRCVASWRPLPGIAIGIAASCLVARAAPVDDPLSRLLTSDSDSLCFRRDYGGAHLKRHPAQATQAVLVSFRNDAVRIMLRQKGRDRYLVAGCTYRKGAGHDTSGALMIKSFKKPVGYDCIVIVAPASAEEGGYVLLDPAADGSSLVLHAQSPITARAGLDGKASAYNLKLGRDDREFFLARTDPAACRTMEQGLEPP
jgi:hypothetical protein